MAPLWQQQALFPPGTLGDTLSALQTLSHFKILCFSACLSHKRRDWILPWLFPKVFGDLDSCLGSTALWLFDSRWDRRRLTFIGHIRHDEAFQSNLKTNYWCKLFPFVMVLVRIRSGNAFHPFSTHAHAYKRERESKRGKERVRG